LFELVSAGAILFDEPSCDGGFSGCADSPPINEPIALSGLRSRFDISELLGGAVSDSPPTLSTKVEARDADRSLFEL
jgi:hypothetical protein